MVVFYLLALVALWLGILSLISGLRFASYIRAELATPLTDYTPFVAVIFPFRGLDQNLRENLEALYKQNYPAYEIIFVTDSAGDPALNLVRAVAAKSQLQLLENGSSLVNESHEPLVDVPSRGEQYPKPRLKLVIAGPATEAGQKVHNLQQAVTRVDNQTEVIVFVDSDVRTHEHWLRALVTPLQDHHLGAVTGYRWFIVPKLSFSGQLRSVWNASITSALGGRSDRNFCWGGSTAIRRQTFEELQVVENWRGSVSDDFTLTRMLQQANRPIKFAPRCLIVSRDICGPHELIEFTTRQLKITRVYAAHLWKAVLLGNAQFVLVFFGGMILMWWRWYSGFSIAAGAFLLAIIFMLGAGKAWIRLAAVRMVLSGYQEAPTSLVAHLWLWPIASALFLYNAIAAACSRRIHWRGISYELKSPVEAVIITSEGDNG